MLDLAQHLFGVEIRPWATEVWAPDVSAYEMVRNGAVIGRFYFDMHPREGKYTHAAIAPLRIGIKGRELPVAVLMTNFPKGLIEHGDVVTFLHEFAHLKIGKEHVRTQVTNAHHVCGILPETQK